MKRIFAVIILCLVSASLFAQSRISYSFEVSAGAGVWKGPLATVAPEFVAQYSLGGDFKLGAGAGLRLGAPCFQHITKNGSSSRTFCLEVDVPVFLRLGYGSGKLLFNLDAGYSIGVLSMLGSGWSPGGMIEPRYGGIFFEPQVGIKTGEKRFLALGVLLQQSMVRNYVTTVTGTPADPSYSTQTKVNTQLLLTPAITIRYGFGF